MTDLNKMQVKLRYADKFEKLLNKLFLTDRQKDIARLKYLNGWASADVAEELEISRRTVTAEMQVIRDILGKVDLDKWDVDNEN